MKSQTITYISDPLSINQPINDTLDNIQVYMTKKKATDLRNQDLRY